MASFRRLLPVLLLVLLCATQWHKTECAKKAPVVQNDDDDDDDDDGDDEKEKIEEVNAKELDVLLESEPLVAVLFYGKLCGANCDKILEELEHIDDDAEHFGISFVKTLDRRYAKNLGIHKFPALIYFRHKEPTLYEGDLLDEDKVLEWLTDISALENPNAIEEVNARMLTKIVEDNEYVAAVFYRDGCKKCDKVLRELENIDDEADQLDIAFVKTRDEKLMRDYGFEEVPVLVYYRNRIPLPYEGDLLQEEDVLDWLVTQRNLGEDEDVIEDVTKRRLAKLIDEEDYLAVLFYDNDDKESMRVLKELENVDDDAEKKGITFVKIDDPNAAKEYGIDDFPTLVYFENEIPSVYEGDLLNEEEVLKWLVHQLHSDEIEEVTDEMLDKLLKDKDVKGLVVLFVNEKDKKCQDVLAELENIDDDLDRRGIAFVMVDDEAEAREYGLDGVPSLVYFENGVPSVFEGDLSQEEEVLKWVLDLVEKDEIEDVSDDVLDSLIDRMDQIAVVFYDSDKKSQKVLKELENIDDDLDKHGIALVKTDEKDAAKKYGIDTIPSVVYFENEIPFIYQGDLLNEEKLLDWLIRQTATDEIEDVNDEMLEILIKKSDGLAVLFYNKKDKKSEKILKELEDIDDDLDKNDIEFVKIDDTRLQKEFGIDEVPSVVYFENGIPSFYEGDLLNEDELLKWLIEQNEEDTIEEVTDEVLDDIIKDHEYVAVLFTGPDCKQCEAILKELEEIDDDADSHGMVLITTEETHVAKSHGIRSFPTLALFRNGNPIIYKGNLMDEDAVLAWLTDDDTFELPDAIEEVNKKMLSKLIKNSDNLVVFFYDERCKKCEKILTELENIDDDADQSGVDFVKCSDPGIAKEYGLVSLPTLVYYRKRMATIYDGNLEDEDKVLDWILDLKDKPGDEIESVDKGFLGTLMEEAEHLVVYFYEEDSEECETVLQELEKIDDDTDKHGIHFVKTSDVEFAHELGVSVFPSLVYFENNVPSIYEGDLEDEESLLEWLVKQKEEDTIANINREMLYRLLEDKDFVAVFFYIEDDDDSEIVSNTLELIDDEVSQYGIELVKTTDLLIAKKYGIRRPPGIVYFRKGKHILFTGDMEDEEEILDWLTDPDNMEMHDHIETVNRKMLEKISKRSHYLTVLFYSEANCRQCEKVLHELEKIDDDADNLGIDFVKVDDPQLARELGVFALPAIVFFKQSNDPVIYAGDLKNEERILEWLIDQKDPEGDVIEEVEGKALEDAIRNSEHIAVYFYTSDEDECDDCQTILQELENIDDDTDRHGIKFVKTQDLDIAENWGLREIPSLVYFERRVPNIYEGDLLAEEEVLQWLIHNRNEETIETVNRELLERLIGDAEYLVVFFYKGNCLTCDQALEDLEKIDQRIDSYGINMVKILDVQLAKRYGIKTFPALVYFRNGNPLIFDGDMKSEESILDWLLDDENRELADEIENVNGRMLKRLIDDSPFLAVFFYDEEDCDDCAAILSELENIDDEADAYGIDFVKINDPEAATEHGILHTPALVYFRHGEPITYDGDLLNEDRLLSWMTSQDVIDIKDEIIEVNRKMLDKFLEDNDFVAVYFYDSDCQKCDEVLAELEHIDDEADSLDITFVKIKDPRYARKYGINHVPALIYFRRKFPSIYRGDLTAEEEVLEWLQRNRYRQFELNLFMYALAGIAAAFILYTCFLIFCFKKGEHAKAA